MDSPSTFSRERKTLSSGLPFRRLRGSSIIILARILNMCPWTSEMKFLQPSPPTGSWIPRTTPMISRETSWSTWWQIPNRIPYLLRNGLLATSTGGKRVSYVNFIRMNSWIPLSIRLMASQNMDTSFILSTVSTGPSNAESTCTYMGAGKQSMDYFWGTQLSQMEVGWSMPWRIISF